MLLLVKFKKPVRTEFALAFGTGQLETLASIATAGTVSMVTRDPQVRNGVIGVEAYNVVSVGVDRPGLQEIWDKLPTLQAMALVLEELHGSPPACRGNRLT